MTPRAFPAGFKFPTSVPPAAKLMVLASPNRPRGQAQVPTNQPVAAKGISST